MTRAILALVISLAMLGYLMATGGVSAQEHRHPPHEAALHDQFYSTWMRPDNRNASCCNKQDCHPAEAKMVGRQWHVRRDADGKWLPVPFTQIETGRDSPDGRSHACYQRPELGDTVYCFLPAAGG